MKNITFLVLTSLLLISCLSDKKITKEEYKETSIASEVSNDLLDDFFFLDRTLHKTNRFIKHNTEELTYRIEETTKSKNQYKPLVGVAKKIRTLTEDYNAYVDNLRNQLAQESGGLFTIEEAYQQGNPQLEGRPKGLNNKEAANNVFVIGNNGPSESNGEALDKKIFQLRKDYLSVVASLWDNGGIQGTVFAAPSKKEVYLRALEEEFTLTSSENYVSYQHGEKTWVEYTFSQKSVARVYPILRRFQNEALISEAAIVNFLASQMGKLELTYDNFEVFAQSPKPYIRLGETYEADIMLGAYSSQARFSVSVNGSSLKIVAGKAKYTAKGTSVGEKKYTAKVSVSNPLTGEVETFTKDYYYEVGK